MAYLKINDIDFSMYVSGLKVATEHIYKQRTNAAGNTLIKYVNTKYVIEASIIPLNQTIMAQLQKQINNLSVSVSFLDPDSKELKTIDCIIPKQIVEYYTIQDSNVKFKAFTLNFQEL